MNHPLQWKKFHPLSDQNAFICLVNHMGDDSSIVQAARVSYGKDENYFTHPDNGTGIPRPVHEQMEAFKKDRQLIRYLMNHQHGTPFEMVEIQFMVQVPMDCWRQWIRHRTANINEYSTRYTEALDFFQVTSPEEWRLQSTDNKQGSSGYLTEWPESVGKVYTTDFGYAVEIKENETIHCVVIPFNWYKELGYEFQPPGGGKPTPGQYLSWLEKQVNEGSQNQYQMRLLLGIAKEQARKDLPLSTYTRAYWKCDLRNIFNFLQLRMDSHAQLEIRSFANCMAEIVKQLCPVAYEAFEDYVLHAKKFSRMETQAIKYALIYEDLERPASMTDREWKEFLEKLACTKL
jgi:thymidylate synthase (FAD)